jgi:hypothetical protein
VNSNLGKISHTGGRKRREKKVDTTIILTPATLIAGILAGCAAIITISGAISVLIKVYNNYRNPDKQRDEAIKLHEEYLENDKRKIEQLEEGNRITMQALLALMSHAINGNDIDKLKEAKEELQDYLIKRH